MNTFSTVKQARRQYTFVGICMLLMILFSTLLPVISEGILHLFFPNGTNSAVLQILVRYSLWYLFGYPYVFLLLRLRTFGTPPRHKLGAARFVEMAFICIGLMIVGNLIGTALNAGIGAVLGRVPDNALNSFITTTPFWLRILLPVLIGPILEEWIFRKGLVDALYPLGEPVCVVVGAITFGLIHGNFYQFFYAALLGGLFTVIYCRTGKLRYTVLLHIFVNFVGSIVGPGVQNIGIKLDAFLAPHLGAEQSLGTLLVGCYSILVMVAAVIGMVFFFRRLSATKLRVGTTPLPHPTLSALTSFGNILFFAVCIILFITNL